MLELTLALGTIIRDIEIRSGADDFPLAVPFTTVADDPADGGFRSLRRWSPR